MTNAQTWVGAAGVIDRLDLDALTAALPADATHLSSFLAYTRVTGLLELRREASNAAASPG
jgi:hypothetical protein